MTDFENLTVFLDTATACGVWVLVGLLAFRLYSLGKHSNLLGVLLALGLMAGASAQTPTYSTGFENGGAAVPFSSLGWTWGGSGSVSSFAVSTTNPRTGAYRSIVQSGIISKFQLNYTRPSEVRFWARSAGSATFTVFDGSPGVTISGNKEGADLAFGTTYTEYVLTVPSGPAWFSFYTSSGFPGFLIDDVEVFVEPLPLGTYSISAGGVGVGEPGSTLTGYTGSATGFSWTGASDVPLTWDLPAGFTVSGPSTVPVDGLAGSYSIAIGSGVAGGEYSGTVTSTSDGYMPSPVSLSFTVLEPFTFTLYVSPSPLALNKNDYTTFHVWAQCNVPASEALLDLTLTLPAGVTLISPTSLENSVPWSLVGVPVGPPLTITVHRGSSDASGPIILGVVAQDEVGNGASASVNLEVSNLCIGCSPCNEAAYWSLRWNKTTKAFESMAQVPCEGDSCSWCYIDFPVCMQDIHHGAIFNAYCVVNGNCERTERPGPCSTGPPDPPPPPDPPGDCGSNCSGSMTFKFGQGTAPRTWQLIENNCGADCNEYFNDELWMVGSTCLKCFPECPVVGDVVTVPCTHLDRNELGGIDSVCPEHYDGASQHYWAPEGNGPLMAEYGFTIQACERCEVPAGCTGSIKYEVQELDGVFVWQRVGVENIECGVPANYYGSYAECLPECGALGEVVFVPAIPSLKYDFDDTVPVDCPAGEGCLTFHMMALQVQKLLTDADLVPAVDDPGSWSPLMFDWCVPYKLDGSCFPIRWDLRCGAVDTALGYSVRPRGLGSGPVCRASYVLLTLIQCYMVYLFIRMMVADVGGL